MTVRLLIGDCRDQLRELADESVHCVVTSPPYFGLRDYGTASWDGGDPGCDHLGAPMRTSAGINASWGEGFKDGKNPERRNPFGAACGKCGAQRRDQQIGLEATPEAYVAELVDVFREVRRVLRKDGTLWLNLGDSYASSSGQKTITPQTAYKTGRASGGAYAPPKKTLEYEQSQSGFKDFGNLKAKDLIGIPWRAAFALQADGWYLRQDIIWAKPNPMPESVTDRCTKAHEYLFLLSKSARYHFDAEAIAEAAAFPEGPGTLESHKYGDAYAAGASEHRTAANLAKIGPRETRNKRSVWTVASQAFSEAHFATYPPDLIEPCVLAGCPAQCCARCGAPWGRILEMTAPDGRSAITRPGERRALPEDGQPLIGDNMFDAGTRGSFNASRGVLQRTTIGWEPTCDCAAEVTRGVVLDPFSGAGTTGLVADRLQRDAILIELNPAYADISRKRLVSDAPLFCDVA